jgi:hypothetical protein
VRDPIDLFPGKLRFRDNEGRIIDSKVQSIAIALLRIAQARASRIAVKYCNEGA